MGERPRRRKEVIPSHQKVPTRATLSLALEKQPLFAFPGSQERVCFASHGPGSRVGQVNQTRPVAAGELAPSIWPYIKRALSFVTTVSFSEW